MKKKIQRRIIRNADIMAECMRQVDQAFLLIRSDPDSGKRPGAGVFCRMAEALFNSVVPSASQREATKRAVGMIEGALTMLDSAKPEPLQTGRFLPTYPVGGDVWEGLKSQVGPPPSPKKPDEECVFCGRYAQCVSVDFGTAKRPVCKKCLDRKREEGRIIGEEAPYAPEKEEGEEEDEETEEETAPATPFSFAESPSKHFFQPFSVYDDGPTCEMCEEKHKRTVFVPRSSERKSVVICDECIWKAYHTLRQAFVG